jgi:hypothetical protein
MEFRLDSPFESWGGFSRTAEDSPIHYGKLRYAPDKGVELELSENPWGVQSLQGGMPPVETMFGQLVDGTRVTLAGGMISNTAIQIGIGIGAPTTIFAHRALFGIHAESLDDLPIKEYTLELSSLSNWTCASPVKTTIVNGDADKPIGFDIQCRQPASIEVPMPAREFDVRIGHGIKTNSQGCTTTATRSAGIAVVAHSSMPLQAAHEASWQCQNLMSLLIGDRLSVRAVSIVPVDEHEDSGKGRPLQLIYQQVGQHDRKDLHPALMLLPYGMIKDQYAAMVNSWFERSEQAILATNVFFGAQGIISGAVNVKFLIAVQAAESYHRALGTGVYMDQAAYEAAIQELTSHIPAAIQGDHRVSLKNRLKYGNEHSLRKRLTELLNRLPEQVRLKIAEDCPKFVNRMVEVRNYYTHYEHAAAVDGFEGKEVYTAAERIRILIVANLLRDLGVPDDALLNVLQRSQDFNHWLSQPLKL